jgi:hypothetical protein
LVELKEIESKPASIINIPQRLRIVCLVREEMNDLPN